MGSDPNYENSGAWCFFVAVFLNAFVDLGHKITIQNTLFKLYSGPYQVIMTALVNALILLPFIALLTPAGFLSDRYNKLRIMRQTVGAASRSAPASCCAITSAGSCRRSR